MSSIIFREWSLSPIDMIPPDDPPWILRHAIPEDIGARLTCGCELTQVGQPYVVDCSSGESLCPHDYFTDE